MITATSWISTRPGRCGGDACVRETRVPVWALVERRREGRTDEQILGDLPDLTSEDLSVAWKYAEDHGQEIERSLWQNEACMVENAGSDEIRRLILRGGQLGFSDDDIREAFYPALGREDLTPILRSLRTG